MKKEKNKSKYIANISLAAMGVGFLATLPIEQTISMRILQGGFEAGLVGGLADWFAVTALFRHPLNIPIPHTALLPKNRDKMTNAILNVAEKELLNKNSIMEKVSKIQITKMILGKLEEEVESEKTKVLVKKALQTAFHYVDKEKIEEVCHRSLGQVVKGMQTKPLLVLAVDKTLENKYDEKAYEAVLGVIEKKLSNQETKDKITAYALNTLEQKAGNGFFKIALVPLLSAGKEKLASIIDKSIIDILADLKQENSANRQNILAYIQKEFEGLKDNEEILKTIESKKDEWIEGEGFVKVNHYLIDTIYQKLETLIQDDVFIDEKVMPFIKGIILKVKEDEQMVDKIEVAIKETIANLIEQNHSKIGVLIKDNLEKLDNDQLIDMMENKIGKELSWIRVNGSICGFLIGLVLASIKLFA